MQLVTLDTATRNVLNNVAPGVFDNAICQSGLDAFLNCPRHHMGLAVDNQLVVGMVSAVEYFHPDKAPQWWINEVAVAPVRQNQGVGRQLLAYSLREAKRRGCTAAWLGTAADNAAAQRCFRSLPHGLPATPFVLFEWPLSEQTL